jgi:outer membrane protein assembly factor BamB
MKNIVYYLLCVLLTAFTACEDENLPKASSDKAEVASFEAIAGDEEVTLHWEAMVNAHPTGYYLSWTASSSTVQGGETNLEGNITFTVIKELVNGETYTFSIQPVYGEKGRGGQVQVKARPVSSRPAPTNFMAIPGDEKAGLQWTRPTNEALTGYTLTVSPGDREVSISKDAETYEVTGLVNETEYAFTLKAVYPNGFSDAVNATATPTKAPVGFLWSEIQMKSGELSGYVKTSNPVFSPDGSTMYVPTSSPNGHLFAIDVLTGAIKWIFEITELTYGGGALVGNDGTIYQGSDAAIYAINPNGTQKWKITTSGAGALARVRAFPAMSADGTLYCVSNSTLYALNASSGSEVWTKPLPNSASIGSAVLVGKDGIIYVGTNKGMFAYTPEGTDKWSNTDALLNVTESGSMAIDDNTIYAALKGTAGVAAINATDGTLKWNAGAAGDAYFPIVDKNGAVYFVEKNASGNVYAINPNGTQKWIKNIGGSLNYGGLALDENGIVYGGTQKVNGNYKVYAIDTATGEFVFNDDNEQQLMSVFTIGPDKRLYFGTIGTVQAEGGKIQAYEINAGIETSSWSVRGGDWQGTNRQK